MLLRIACTCSLILAVQCGLYADDGTSDKFWGYAPTAATNMPSTECGDRANNTCGPTDWAEVDVGNSSCGALYQSPINLNTTGATFSDHQAAVKLSTDLACMKGGQYSVDPHGIEVNINLTCQSKMNATWTLGNQTNVYSLLSYRFHTPSEHTINGQFFEMEAHLIHKHAVTGDIVVLAVFMKSDPSLKAKCLAVNNNHVTCQRANFVESVFLGGMNQSDAIYAVSQTLAPTSLTRYLWNQSTDPYLGFVPPIGQRYYWYNGSLTTPPCTTGVQWILHPHPVLIYNTTVGLWKNISGAYVDNGLTQGVNHSQNARATQAMDGRKLYVAGRTGYTSLTTAAVAGSLVLNVVDVAGFAVGDTIIIEPRTSRQEGNTVARFGSVVLTTPLHYTHPAGAAVYSQTTTSPGVTVTPVAGAATTTPVATVTPIVPIRRYTEGKAISTDVKGNAIVSNAVFLGVGCLIGMVVVMIVQGVRSKVQSATDLSNKELPQSDYEDGEARLLSEE